MNPNNKETATDKQSNFTPAAGFSIIHAVYGCLFPVGLHSDLIERAYYCPHKTNREIKQIIGQVNAELSAISKKTKHIQRLVDGRFFGMPKGYENFKMDYSQIRTSNDTIFNALFESYDSLVNALFGLFDADKEQGAAMMAFTRGIKDMQAKLKVIDTAVQSRTRPTGKTCRACKNGCSVFKGAQ